MDYVGRSQIMETCPSVLVAYLGVLTSLAATQQGAQAVHGQLSNSGTMYATLSWTRAFDIMKTYCQRYSQDSQQVGARRLLFLLPANFTSFYQQLFAGCIAVAC